MIRKNLKALVRLTKVATIGAAAALVEDVWNEEEKRAIDQMLLAYLKELFPQSVTWGEERSHRCHDCEGYGYGYMLKDEVWAEATQEEDIRYLCLWCVQGRLGRVLPGDFSEAPINDPLCYIFGRPRPERKE